MDLRHHDNEIQALSLAAAKVQYKRGSYSSSLDLAIKACGASLAPVAPGSQPALLMESLSLATRAALCCSQPAKALKYASRMVFLDPQDAVGRELVRECTREMEYEARLLSLQAANEPDSAASLHGNGQSSNHMPGEGTGSVAQNSQLHIHTLLAQLVNGRQPGDVASLLNQLTQATLQGVDSQIAFLLASGYVITMNLMVSHSQEVEGLLMAAGMCRLYQPTHCKHHQQQQQQLQLPPSQFVRVRWPQSVLDRLVTLALGAEQDSDLVSRCMGLLAVAAQDRLQRHRAFVTQPMPAAVNQDGPEAPFWYPPLSACRPVLTNLGQASWPLDDSHHPAPTPAVCAHIRTPLVDQPRDHLSGPPTPRPTPPPLPGLWTPDTFPRTMHDPPTMTQTAPFNHNLPLSTHSTADPSTSQPCAVSGAFMSMAVQAGVVAACGHREVDTNASTPSGGDFFGVCTPPAGTAPEQQSMSSNRQSLDGTGAITPTTCTLLKAEQLSLELWSLYEAAGSSTATPSELQGQQEQSAPTASTQHINPDHHMQPSSMEPGCNHAIGSITNPAPATVHDGALVSLSLQRSRSEGWKGLLGLAIRTPRRSQRDHQIARAAGVGSREHPIAEAPEASACSSNHCRLPAPDSVLSRLVAGLHALCQEAIHVEALSEPAGNRRATASTGVGASLGMAHVIPVHAAVCAAQLMHSFCTDEHSLHLLSETQQPVATLLALHRALHSPCAPEQRTPAAFQQWGSPRDNSMLRHGLRCPPAVPTPSSTSTAHMAADVRREEAATMGVASSGIQHRASKSTACAWAAGELCNTARTAPACCAAARVTLDCVSCLCGRVQGAAMAEAFYGGGDSSSTSEPHTGSGAATSILTLSDYQFPKQLPRSGSTADVSSRRLARSASTTSLVSPSGSARLLPTPLLASLVLYARNVVASSPPCMQPETGLRDCRVQGYTLGKRAVDPCQLVICGPAQPVPTSFGLEAISSTSFTAAQSSTPVNPPSTASGSPWGFLSHSTSLLQAWLCMFMTLAGVGRQVSRELFRAGLTDVLKDIATQFRTDSELVSGVQKAGSRLALHCPGALEESVEEGHIHGLIGVAAHGLKCVLSRIDQPLALPAGPYHHRRSSSGGSGSSILSSDSTSKQQRSLRHMLNITLRSLDKLAQLLDSCSGAEFLELVQPQGLLAQVHMLVGRHQPRRISRSFSLSATMRNRAHTLATSPASNSPAIPRTPSGSPASPWPQPSPVLTHVLLRPPSMRMVPEPSNTCSTNLTGLQTAAAHSPAPFQEHITPLPPLPSSPAVSASTKPVLNRATTDLVQLPLGRVPVELLAAPGDVCGELLPAMCDAGRCVLLGCLERARRAAGLRPDQVPCVGWFGTIRPKELLNLEHGLRAQWAAALLPHQPPRLPAIPSTPPRSSWPGGFARPATDQSLDPAAGSTTASIPEPPGCNPEQATTVKHGSGTAGFPTACPGLASTGPWAGASTCQRQATTPWNGGSDRAGAGLGHHPSSSAGIGPVQSQAEARPLKEAASLEIDHSAGWHEVAANTPAPDWLTGLELPRLECVQPRAQEVPSLTIDPSVPYNLKESMLGWQSDRALSLV